MDTLFDCVPEMKAMADEIAECDLTNSIAKAAVGFAATAKAGPIAGQAAKIAYDASPAVQSLGRRIAGHVAVAGGVAVLGLLSPLIVVAAIVASAFDNDPNSVDATPLPNGDPNGT